MGIAAGSDQQAALLLRALVGFCMVLAQGHPNWQHCCLGLCCRDFDAVSFCALLIGASSLSSGTCDDGCRVTPKLGIRGKR